MKHRIWGGSELVLRFGCLFGGAFERIWGLDGMIRDGHLGRKADTDHES